MIQSRNCNFETSFHEIPIINRRWEMTKLCNTNIIIEYKLTDFEEDDKNKTIWVMLIDKKDNNRKANSSFIPNKPIF